MSEPGPSRAVRVRVSGRVQGVWFRAWTQEQARDQGLAGWVRNCRDGSVEAVFSGPREAVDRMVVLCRRGPPLAKVSGIEVADEPGLVPEGFRQVPDA